jgi:hypothetical protein
MSRQPPSYDYLEAALSRARRVLSRDDFTAIHMAARGYAGGKAKHRYSQISVPEESPEMDTDAELADVLFVSGTPSDLDVARGMPFAGSLGPIFKEYTEGVDHYAIVYAVPRRGDVPEKWAGWLAQKIQKLDPQKIIALGDAASLAVIGAIGTEPDETIPHPKAVALKPERRTQVIRKMARVIRGLDVRSEITVDTAQPEVTSPGISREVKISKADKPRQIVYAAVLDPYQVDAHDDWVPPIHVEETAHRWLTQSRVVGLQHTEQADAYPVESWIVPYPSEEDYSKAVKGEPHRVHRMPFGSETVHSGTWILGTKLGDKSWAEYLAGNVGGYSVAGYGFRTDVTTSAMPEVTFVDLAEVR